MLDQRSIRLAGGVAGVVGPAVFTLAWVVSTLLQEGYSARRETVSALAALTADVPWLMIGGFVVMGVCTLLLGIALHLQLAGGRGRWWGPGLLIVAGAGIVASGVFRNDCSTLTEACDALIEAGEVSAQHTAHDLAGVPVFLSLMVLPAVLSFRFREDAQWRVLAPWALALTPVLLVLIVLFAGDVIAGWSGLVQRVLITLAFGFVAVLGVRVVRLAHEERAPAPAALSP